MDPDLRVRPARPEDDAALVAIDRLTTTSLSSPAPERAAHRTSLLDDDDPAAFLVAEAGGRVVGYVALHQDVPLASHAHVLTIDGLGVEPAAQGRGVGEALVRAAVALARARGACKVTLRVLAPNASARRLYERCGFEVEGVLRGEFVLDGRTVDDVLMARAVPR